MKVLILNGSPKKKLGASWYISKIFKPMLPGCKKIEIAIKESNYDKIFSLLGEVDAVVLSVPLYVDSVPSHVLSFLQTAEKVCAEQQHRFKFYVISNSGFIEGRQNAVHLDIYRCWCERAQVEWGGGLGIGGGVMIFVLMFVILVQLVILLIGIISNAISGAPVLNALRSFVPSLISWLFFNAGVLFFTARLARAVRRGATTKNLYTRVMLPSFIFLVVADIFMALMALFKGNLIFSLYRKDRIEE